VFWNADYDVPRLKDEGFSIRSEILDAMWMWHWYRTRLPKSLGSVAPFWTTMEEWKSQGGMYPELYSCMDSDAQIQCTYGTRDCLQREGQHRWDSFVKHFLQLDPILKHMGRGEHSGLLVDLDAREKFKEMMEEQKGKAQRKLDQLVPQEVLAVKQFARAPIEFRCRKCKGNGEVTKVRSKNKEKYKEITPCEECDQQGYIPGLVPETVEKGGKIGRYVQEDGVWYWVRDFLPSSSKEVLGLIAYLGDPIPRDFKKGAGEKGTTGKTGLERLYRTHLKKKSQKFKDRAAIYRGIIDWREAEKMITTYLDYPIDEDGKVRTNFGQKPATLRLNSWNPNMQNVRKRWEHADLYRRMFKPRPGCVLVGTDYSGIEALIVGHEAKSPEYMKAARYGVHAIMTSHLLVQQGHWKEPISLAWSDADIAEAVVEIAKNFSSGRKSPYDTCKIVVHASNYNPNPAFRILQDNPEVFSGRKEIDHIVNMYFSTVGAPVKKWQQDLVEQVHQTHYLETPFGYRFWFWDVLDPVKRTLGTQAKELLAAGPQSSAAAIIKNAILGIAEHDVVLKNSLRLQIHDELVYELRDNSFLDQRIAKVVEIMQRPIPEMDGLIVGTKTKLSRNSWGEMEKWRPA
jgi:hypothetical protein